MQNRGWIALPALRHALAFSIGVIVADLAGLRPEPVALSLAACLFVLAIVVTRSPGTRHRVLGGLAVAAVAASTGATLRTVERTSRELPQHLSLRGVDVVGSVADEPRLRAGQLEFTLDSDSLLLRSGTARVRRRVLVRVRAWPGERSGFETGSRVAVLGTVRSPRLPRYPGDLDESAWLAARGLDLVMDVSRPGNLLALAPPSGSGIDAILVTARRVLRSFADERIGGKEGGVVRALLLGERDGIDEDVRDAFARTGTIHVLSVSGLHVSVIAAGLAVFVTWFANRWLRLAAFVAMLAVYVLIVGAAPSIVRSWIMASALMLGAVAGRQTTTLNLLGAAALIILIASPSELYSPGFQLSFVAVAGIGLLYARSLGWLDDHLPRLMERRVLRWIASGLVVTLAAQLPTIPLLLMHFGSLPVLGLILNLAIVPLTSIALGASFAGALFSWLGPVADAYATTAFATVRAAIDLAELGAGLPFASAGPWWLPWPAVLALAAGIAFALSSRTVRSALLRLGLAAVASSLVTILAAESDPLSPRGARAAYLLPGSLDALVAVQRDNTLVGFVRSADSAGIARRLIARLARRVGADDVHVVDLRSARDARAAGVARVGRRAWLVADPPMLLTSTRARGTGIVRLGEHRLLQVALRQRPRRAVVLHLHHDWERIQWD